MREIIRMDIGNTGMEIPKCATEQLKETAPTSGYSDPLGETELREAIAKREHCNSENVVVGPGSKLLLFGLASILGRNGCVFPAPYWPVYRQMCKILGIKWRTVVTRQSNSWIPDKGLVRKEKMVIINSPNNPTSTIYPEEILHDLIERCSKEGISLVIDEAYKGLAFRKIAECDAIRVRSFSKEFSMENLRLGYAVAPKNLILRLREFILSSSTCVPVPVQLAGLACLRNEQKILGERRKIWKERMGYFGKLLIETGFEFSQSDSPMYIFATHKKISDSKKFVEKCLEKGVAISSGLSYGNYGRHVRICPNQSNEQLDIAFGGIIASLK